MKAIDIKPLSVAGFLGASLMLAACTSVGPTVITAPPFSLAPGATATVPPLVTLPPTLAPGATIPPITAPPLVTLPPLVTVPPVVTLPPVTQPPVTLPPATAEPTPTLEHPNWPLGAIEPKEAINHVGQHMTVCGNVNATNWVFAEKGHPTWINLGPAYPNLKFTAVIWGEQRREWPLNGKPDVVYLGRQICVTGVIEAYKTWTQIEDVSKVDIQVIQ